MLVLVSDDPNAYASFVKHKDGVVLCRSVWSFDGLKAAQQWTGELDTKMLDERLGVVGSVPRSVSMLLTARSRSASQASSWTSASSWLRSIFADVAYVRHE